MSEEWSEYWRLAHNNMPKRHLNNMGSSAVLRALLGYSTVTKTGGKVGKRVSCEQHVKTAIERGDKPRDPERQRVLKMLAGPHGTTLVKAIAIQRGLDLSAYKYWPYKGGYICKTE